MRKKLFLVMMVSVLALTGCGNGKEEASAERRLPEESYENVMDVVKSGAEEVKKANKEKIEAKDTEETEETKDPKVSGFHKKTNQTIEFHGIEFSVPAYFDVCDEESTEDFMHYYPEEKEYYCSLLFQKTDAGISQEEFDDKKSEMAMAVMESFGEDHFELIKSEDMTIAGLPGWTLSCVEKDKEKPSTQHYSFVYLADRQEIISILEVYDGMDESNYDYDGDYKKIIESAVLTGGQGGEESENKETQAQSQSASKGLDPDFKAMMDSYEEFFNAYVDFMKEYTDSENPIGMLKEYSDFMEKYVDVMEKLNSIDSNELSTEDYKYYIDVYSRISKKLLEVYE